MSDYITDSVDGILKLFGPQKMMLLYDDFVRIFEMWNTTPEKEKELQQQCESSLDLIKLIRSAYALSILAENHARDLKRIIERYPKFHITCEKITKSTISKK